MREIDEAAKSGEKIVLILPAIENRQREGQVIGRWHNDAWYGESAPLLNVNCSPAPENWDGSPVWSSEPVQPSHYIPLG